MAYWLARVRLDLNGAVIPKLDHAEVFGRGDVKRNADMLNTPILNHLALLYGKVSAVVIAFISNDAGGTDASSEYLDGVTGCEPALHALDHGRDRCAKMIGGNPPIVVRQGSVKIYRYPSAHTVAFRYAQPSVNWMPVITRTGTRRNPPR
jgi:hypothetical protein